MYPGFQRQRPCLKPSSPKDWFGDFLEKNGIAVGFYPYILACFALLALLLWPHHSFENLFQDFFQLLQKENAAIFLCFSDEKPVGFAQCQLRFDYVEGTHNSPVGYLEGIFVRESQRGKGIATALLNSCERWAKEKGCLEFASDCEIDNVSSEQFHLQTGFSLANRIICFVKTL